MASPLDFTNSKLLFLFITIRAPGNYEKAIELAIKKLKKNQSSKKRDGHIEIIEQAFQKAVAKATS